MAADEDATFRRFVAIAAAHHKNPHWAFFVDSVLDAFQPAVHPGELQIFGRNYGLWSKCSLTGEAAFIPTMSPRAHSEPLQALLGFRESGIVQVGHTKRPRIVPAANVVNGNVFVFMQVSGDVDANIFPIRVVIAMRHYLNQG